MLFRSMPLRKFSVPYRRRTSLWEELAISSANLTVLLRAQKSQAQASLLHTLRLLNRHVPILNRLGRLVPRAALMRMTSMTSETNGPVGQALPLKGFPSNAMRQFYGAQARFSAAKAKADLHWEPRVRADRAIGMTCEWIRYAGI